MLSLNPLSIVQKIAGIAALSAILVLTVLWQSAQGNAEHYAKLYVSEHTARAVEQQQVRDKTAQAKTSDALHAATVTIHRNSVSTEKSNGYQKDLADLRARAAAQRMRARASATDPGSRRGTPVPGLPDSADGPDGTACQDGLPDPDRLTASEQAIRLKALQEWIRAQQQIAN